MAGIRSGAGRKLEMAFASAFATYFVGDQSYVMPKPNSGALFVAAQAVQKLTFPNVTFLCLEAKEVAPGTANYQGVELHLMVNTALAERPDDFESLLALHDDRVDKLYLLLGNAPLLQSLTNAPAAGQNDTRTVRNFFFYGFGEITKEMRIPEANRLCDLISIQTNFRPSDP